MFIEGSNGNYMPLIWQSRKLRRVKSTFTALQVIEVAFMIKCILLEILNLNVENQILPIKCIIVNPYMMLYILVIIQQKIG